MVYCSVRICSNSYFQLHKHKINEMACHQSTLTPSQGQASNNKQFIEEEGLRQLMFDMTVASHLLDCHY